MRSISFRPWLLAIVSAALQALPFAIAGPVPLWRRVFCWFALTPLIVAVLAQVQRHRATARSSGDTATQDSDWIALRPAKAALLGYFCGVLWYLANCYWIYQTMYLYGGLTKPIAAGILLLFSLYLGLYHAIFGWLVGIVHCRAGRPLALVAAPFLWVAVELARARVTGFPWDLLGYAQVDNFMLTRLAPLGGVMMLSFVVAAVCAVFAAACLAKSPVARWSFAIAGLVLAAGLQAGVARHPADDEARHYATLLQENMAVGATGESVEKIDTAQKYKQFEDLSKAPEFPMTINGSELYWGHEPSWTPAASRVRPDLIIWPEAPADFATSDPVFRAQLSELALATSAPVIVGSVGVDMDPNAEGGYREFGSAAIFDKDGSYLGRYDKIHRVPWGEYVPYKQLFFFAGRLIAGVGRMEAGTEHKVFQTNGHTFGVFICYESIFGDEVREFAKNGAEILVNISDDGWYGDTGAPWQHLDMARMRAIENDRWLLRDTNTGVTTAIDPHGRGVFSTPRHVRAAYGFPFEYLSYMTFYTRYGDWFAWVCVFVSAVLLLFGFMRRREVH